MSIPTDKGHTLTRTFHVGEEQALKSWVCTSNETRNIYYLVNDAIGSPTKKVSREEIHRVPFLHVDVDPRVGEDVVAEQHRILSLLTEFRPSPTVIVFSGGGYQALWKLDQPIAIDGELSKAEEAKRYNMALEQKLGGDNCHNVDRVLRLPGTVNWPNAKKLAKGRLPTLARVECVDLELVHDLASFELPITQPVVSHTVHITTGTIDDLSHLVLSDKIKSYIEFGRDPAAPSEASRSEFLFAVCCALVKAGATDTLIRSIITDPAYKISESVLDKGRSASRYAERQISQARKRVGADSQDFVRSGDSQKALPTRGNIRLALEKLCVTVAYDEFARRVVVTDVGSERFVYFDDMRLTKLYLDVIDVLGTKIGKDFFHDVVNDAAFDNKFHPVRDYLDELEWDGIPRLQTWTSRYLGADDTELHRAVGSLLLTAAVRRIKSPGCKFDEMVILEGEQGRGKSSALAILAVRDEWFTDDLPLNADSKRLMEALLGRWMVEAGELQGMRRGDTDALKGILSRTTDKSRLSYDRTVTELPRQCVIVGTTNSAQYLKDHSGNRRFWPIRTGTVDLPAIAMDRDQLWAEAVHREASGASIRLDPALYTVAAEAQQARLLDDPFADVLTPFLEGRTGRVKIETLWRMLDLPSVDRRTPDMNQRLSRVMSALKWTRERHSVDGKRSYFYEKGSPEERQVNLDPDPSFLG